MSSEILHNIPIMVSNAFYLYLAKDKKKPGYLKVKKRVIAELEHSGLSLTKVNADIKSEINEIIKDAYYGIYAYS